MVAYTIRTMTYASAQLYTYDQLACIYNAARVDYIVPMPMNAHRMADYVHNYDIDLSASSVSLNEDHTPTGVVMVGIRGDRAWITRLGVIPEMRGCKVGQGLMETSIENAVESGVRRIQLEVIQGNESAHRLFLKLGFQDVRELLVVRRPPAPLSPSFASWGETITHMEQLEAKALSSCLAQCPSDSAWTEESASLRHLENLTGITLTLSSGECGWALFQPLPFQLLHLVINPDASESMIRALLFQVHQSYPMLDYKVENIPASHPIWLVMQTFGYLEAFRRTEMYLTLP